MEQNKNEYYLMCSSVCVTNRDKQTENIADRKHFICFSKQKLKQINKNVTKQSWKNKRNNNQAFRQAGRQAAD